MDIDDPTVPEFAEWNSYELFAQRVRKERRFATDEASRAFIQTVLATVPPRATPLDKGLIAYRAQIGSDWVDTSREDGSLDISIWGLSADRMIPSPEKVTDGRANPVGIALLYLATNEKTALSEMRPNKDTEVSVAQFRIARDLRVIDLSPGHDSYAILELPANYEPGKTQLNAEEKKRAVWTSIDSAFSTPVDRRDSPLDYLPTQVLAEVFREAGYDGIFYRSHLGDGYNIALFDLTAAKPVNCTPFRVTKIEYEFESHGNTWYASDSNKSI